MNTFIQSVNHFQCAIRITAFCFKGGCNIYIYIYIYIGFTLQYFKMAVMPLVPETKIADVGKLISLGKLLVRKVTWLVLTTTSATLILSRAFGADCMRKIAFQELILFHLKLQRKHTLSLHCDLQRQHTLCLSYILTSSSQPHENVYILQPFSFLFYLFG